MSFYRLELDYPFSFPIEPGISITKHCHDFRPDTFDQTNIYRDPATGLLMLKPSVFDATYASSMFQLSDFRKTAVDGFWRDVKRGASDLANFLSNLFPAGQPKSDLELFIAINKAIVTPPAPDDCDTLVWALESNAYLETDEGIALHYHGLNDEMQRKENWFAFQWDTIYLHFSHTGICRVYQYADRTNMAVDPDLVFQFQYSSPGEMLNKHGYFWLLPIPFIGLLFTHSHTAQASNSLTSNAVAQSIRPILIPWPTTFTEDGKGTMFQGSLFRLALNPCQQNTLGFQRLKFPLTGTFTDGIIDPEYAPTLPPSAVAAIPLETLYQDITATLLNTDASAPWDPTVDKQGRVQCTLTTPTDSHTPFLYGYGVSWNPITQTRVSTPIVLSSYAGAGLNHIKSLEWTQDEWYRFEGTVHACFTTEQAKLIALRGDSTYLLEWSANGTDWTVLDGGLAKDWEIEFLLGQDSADTDFDVTFTLKGFWERFHETNQLMRNALDGLTIEASLNAVLTTAGFSPLTLPVEVQNRALQLPDSTVQWRYAPRQGDNADAIIKRLLFFLSGQGVEYILYMDWSGGADAGVWRVVAKPHDSSIAASWSLVPYTQGEDYAAQIWGYGPGVRLRPTPPEANVFLVEGMGAPQPDSFRIPAPPVVNVDSLYNPDSEDYLGRTVVRKDMIVTVSDIPELFRCARRIAAAAGHRRLTAERLIIPHANYALLPNVRVGLFDTRNILRLDGWIKKRTVVVVYEDNIEHMELEIDRVWEMEVPI